jgi:hypothetical protein
VAEVEESFTGKYLRPLLARTAPVAAPKRKRAAKK